MTGTYHADLGNSGSLRLRAGYNYTRTRIDGIVTTPPQLADYASVLFDRIEQRRVECGQPRDSVRIGGDWQRRRWGVTSNVNRYGEFCSATLNPSDDQVYSPKWLTDVELSYVLAGTRLAVGAQNIFDVFPDRNSTVNSFNGIQTYSRLSPFGFNGRTIYFRVGLKL